MRYLIIFLFLASSAYAEDWCCVDRFSQPEIRTSIPAGGSCGSCRHLIRRPCAEFSDEDLTPGVCGSADGKSFKSAKSIPLDTLCKVGTTSSITGAGPWEWSCGGDDLRAVRCSAKKK